MKLGTIKGIDIKLHVSTLLIIGLVGYYVASSYYFLFPSVSIIELISIGLINGLIILFSILIHELLHSIMAQRYGLKVSEIELYIFGGMAKIEEEPNTPKEEIIIAAIGPISSLILGAFFMILLFTPLSFPPFLTFTFLYSGISNILLGIFNFLPGFPMDGGRVLRSILWRKRGDLISATRTAAKVGTFFGYGFIIYGFFEMFFLGFIGGLWLVFIGMFLNNAARNEYIQTVNQIKLSKIDVKNILSVRNIPIHFNTLISDAIRNYFMLYKVDYFPVVQGDRIVGIIHIEDIKKVPLKKHSEIIVGYVMKPLSEFPFINEEETGQDAYKKLKTMEKFPHLLVVKAKQDKHIIGFIGEQDLMYALKLTDMRIES